MTTITPDKARIAQLIRARRGSISLRAAARESGLSPMTLSRFEREQMTHPDASVLARLAEWLGVQMEELMRRE